MQIYLIRHTRVAIEPGICYGQSDVDVSETFQEEANLIKPQISDINFDLIYSSPLSRCKILSEFLFDIDVNYDNRLQELNFGEWELQKWDDLRNPVVDKWMNDFVHTPCPNGESFFEMYQRVRAFMVEIKQLNSKNIAIVTHSGVIRCILTYLNNEELKDAFKRQIEFGEILNLTL